MSDAIIAAIIIGVIVIFLVGRAVGVFPSGSDETQTEEAGTASSQAESQSQGEQEGFFSSEEGMGLINVEGWSFVEASAKLKQSGYEVAKEGDSQSQSRAGADPGTGSQCNRTQ